MIRLAFREIREYKAAAVMTPLCMIAEVIFETLIPLLITQIVDNGVSAGNINAILYYGGIMLLCALMALLTGIGGGVFAARASTGLAKNLRSSMYRHIQTFSFSNIDRFSTSGLVTRMTTDISNVQNAFQMILRMAVRAPISMITAMFMAFSINPKVAQIYLYAVIFLGCPRGRYGDDHEAVLGRIQKV